ncbi:phage terminase small subunit-related protein, partial [Clostridium puniceum]|uniref:phage terminase small subunit-related protein n=1 Tax=Clostridium puniceum TaxID=29367 RepID=UPI001FA8E29D
MGKTRSPNRDKALDIYIKNNGEITPREIAKVLGESAANISSWKNKDNWNEKLPPNKGGAPKGNLNSLKHMYIPRGYYDSAGGTGVYYDSADYIASNIINGKNIFGLVGSA